MFTLKLCNAFWLQKRWLAAWSIWPTYINLVVACKDTSNFFGSPQIRPNRTYWVVHRDRGSNRIMLHIYIYIYTFYIAYGSKPIIVTTFWGISFHKSQLCGLIVDLVTDHLKGRIAHWPDPEVPRLLTCAPGWSQVSASRPCYRNCNLETSWDTGKKWWKNGEKIGKVSLETYWLNLFWVAKAGRILR